MASFFTAKRQKTRERKGPRPTKPRATEGVSALLLRLRPIDRNKLRHLPPVLLQDQGDGAAAETDGDGLLLPHILPVAEVGDLVKDHPALLPGDQLVPGEAVQQGQVGPAVEVPVVQLAVKVPVDRLDGLTRYKLVSR